MKESEMIKKMAAEDESDNDYRALNWQRKIQRAKRNELFEEKWLPKLLKNEVVVTHYAISQNKYEICYLENGVQETISFFPKANKILIHRLNKWIFPGLPYIIKKFKL